MQFPDSYFESEVRDGFFIAGMMKRAWAAQLEILEDIDKVCRKHGIAYFADWGTLLGAVRHRGFIPWDDDLDICMKRKDYNRFLSIAGNELPENYYLRNIHTDGEYSEMFTRVLNSRQIDFTKDFLDKYHGCPYGMGIDIFVMDYIAPDPEKEEKQLRDICSVMEIVEKLDNGMLSREELSAKGAWLAHTFGIKIDPSDSLRRQLLLLAEEMYAMYGEEEATEITMMQIRMLDGQYRMPKEYYQESIRIPFETTTIPVPAVYDEVLRKEYGNYMESVKRGGAHDYPLYHKQEEALIQKVGENPYAYVYKKEEQDAVPNRGGSAVKWQIRKLLHTLEEQLKELQNKAADTEYTLAVLTKTQETAIALGTMIEAQKGEGTAAVKSLEEYCELIYQMHETIVQGKRPDGNCLFMQQKIEQIKENVGKETDLRQEVLFFPCRAADWGFMESVYRAAQEDSDCIAYVIPVPYFYKNPDQTAKEMQDDSDLFPADVSVTRYDAFDYAAHCPDVIYMQNPYDEYDTAMSVHPFFYASNLKKYTKRLVYIVPYVTDEIDSGDERAVENIKYCAAAPGVIHADRVIVQSEKMRDIYIDILTDFAGEETRGIWEKKVLGLGSPKMDRDALAKPKDGNLPGDFCEMMFKADGSRKKVVLYGTSGAVLLHYKEAALEKIKSVFSLMEEKKDEIVLIWMPDDQGEAALERKYPELLLEYRKLRKQYQADRRGICAAVDALDAILPFCDAYYGDGGYIAQRCLREKIPVMVQRIFGVDGME